MVVALRPLERKCEVSLYEAANRLRSKAGANQNGTDFEDHGYHIFPTWYLNIWPLVDQLGIWGNFADCTDFVQLRAGEFPGFHTLRNLTSAQWALYNIASGVAPPEDR